VDSEAKASVFKGLVHSEVM